MAPDNSLIDKNNSVNLVVKKDSKGSDVDLKNLSEFVLKFYTEGLDKKFLKKNPISSLNNDLVKERNFIIDQLKESKVDCLTKTKDLMGFLLKQRASTNVESCVSNIVEHVISQHEFFTKVEEPLIFSRFLKSSSEIEDTLLNIHNELKKLKVSFDSLNNNVKESSSKKDVEKLVAIAAAWLHLKHEPGVAKSLISVMNDRSSEESQEDRDFFTFIWTTYSKAPADKKAFLNFYDANEAVAKRRETMLQRRIDEFKDKASHYDRMNEEIESKKRTICELERQKLQLEQKNEELNNSLASHRIAEGKWKLSRRVSHKKFLEELEHIDAAIAEHKREKQSIVEPNTDYLRYWNNTDGLHERFKKAIEKDKVDNSDELPGEAER